MAIPDPATTEWVPIWNALTEGPAGPQGPPGPTGPPGPSTGPHHLTHETGGSDAVVNLAGEVITSGIVADARVAATLARRNAANTFTGVNIFQPTADTIGNYPTVTGTLPAFNLIETDQAANARVTVIAVQGGTFVVQARDDAFNYLSNLLFITRAGVITGIGSGLTALHAGNIATGIVAPPRLGSGTADAGTFLRGDSVWASISAIPSGLIAMFATACPAGWTRVASLDNRFPLGAGSFGSTGGSTAHRHDFDTQADANGGHSHGFGGSVSGVVDASGDFQNQYAVRNGDLGLNATNHRHNFNAGFTGTTDAVGAHDHRVRGQTGDGGVLPPYLTVVYCQKD